MNFSRTYLLLATALAPSLSNAQLYYPDWMHGSNVCLNDGAQPYYMTLNSYTEETLEACCERFYKWNYNTCMNSTVVGSGEWYVIYEDGKCSQDCESIGTPSTCIQPGGLASSSTELFPDAETCCSSRLGYLSSGFCNASSNGIPYIGSGEWYVENDRCIQDCETETSTCTLPGGIIEDSYTTLYTDVATCCSTGLSYLDSALCEANSNATSTGTGKFFIDMENGLCKLDEDTSCPVGYTCEKATSNSGTLFDTEASCCETMTWMDSDLCVARTTGIPSEKWFLANTQDEGCMQDCSLVDAAVPEPWCGEITDIGVKMFASVALCCSMMSWVSSAVCNSTSLGIPYTGSERWVVDYENSRCTQDCETETATCTLPGGIIEDSSTETFIDAMECCAKKLSYLDTDLCEANSNKTSTGTGKYFADAENGLCILDEDTTCPLGYTCERATVSSGNLHDTEAACCASLPYIDSDLCLSFTTSVPTEKWFLADTQDEGCTKDCSLTEAAVPEQYCGTVTDLDTKMYATAEQCCSTKLSWIDGKSCNSTSYYGAGTAAIYIPTEKWYYSLDNKCQQDCETFGAPTAACVSPGGLADGTDKALYATVEECCDAKFNYIDNDLCVARSTGNYTNMFYMDYTSGNACTKDCDPASADPACGGSPDDVSVDLFADAASCCSEKLGWDNQPKCIAESNGLTYNGTMAFYVDWETIHCVADCVGAPPCGGVADAWVTTYTTSAECCSALKWIDPALCVLA